MSRPSKLNVERGSRILAACALGMPPGFAAECAGIDRSTWKRWRHRYPFFRARCEALYHSAPKSEPGSSLWIAALEAASGEPLFPSNPSEPAATKWRYRKDRGWGVRRPPKRSNQVREKWAVT